MNALLEQLGIHLEVFGDHTFVCRQLPLWMKDVEEEAFLCDMIDIWEKDKEISLDKLRKHAIATMACHSSIRFNRSLTLDEMKRVIEDLAHCEQPFHCPHGRPTMICMEDKALIHLKNTLYSCFCFYRDKPAFYHGKVMSLLYDFVYTLYSAFSVPQEVKRHTNEFKYYERLSSITNYINEHYTEPITLHDLAELISVTPAYLSRFFQKKRFR